MTLVDQKTGEIIQLVGDLSDTALVLPQDLSYDEWAECGRKLRLMEKAVMWWLGDWWRFGERSYGEAAAQAAPTGFSADTLRKAAWVADRFGESVLRRTDLTFSHHEAVAALEPSERDRILTLASEKDLGVRDVKQIVRQFKEALRIGKAAEEAPALASQGLFQVLCVDPPWRYEYAQSASREIENNYPTMDLAEIKELEIPAADDAVLFCWTTSPKLAESLEVLDAWGFEYRTSFVWVKGETADDPTIGMGYYFRQAHEIVLVAKRGALPVPAAEDRPASVLVAPRAEHSAKPEAFYELIERMYPELSKIELFARSRRPGWEVWGNQA